MNVKVAAFTVSEKSSNTTVLSTFRVMVPIHFQETSAQTLWPKNHFLSASRQLSSVAHTCKSTQYFKNQIKTIPCVAFWKKQLTACGVAVSYEICKSIHVNKIDIKIISQYRKKMLQVIE